MSHGIAVNDPFSIGTLYTGCMHSAGSMSNTCNLTSFPFSLLLWHILPWHTIPSPLMSFHMKITICISLTNHSNIIYKDCHTFFTILILQCWRWCTWLFRYIYNIRSIVSNGTIVQWCIYTFTENFAVYPTGRNINKTEKFKS